MKYVAGVYMASHVAPTVLSVVKHVPEPQPKGALPDTALWAEQTTTFISMFEIVKIDRMPARTPLATIIETITGTLAMPQLAGQAMLVVNMEGAGQAVYEELIAARVPAIAVHVTTAREVTTAQGGYGVPERDIVSVLQLLITRQRMRINPRIELGEEFFSQAADYTRPDRTVEEDGRDLVGSIGVATWYAHRTIGHAIHAMRPRRSEYNPLYFDL